ncbi:unnamed protein product [Urochloa humidicola]
MIPSPPRSKQSAGSIPQLLPPTTILASSDFRSIPRHPEPIARDKKRFARSSSAACARPDSGPSTDPARQLRDSPPAGSGGPQIQEAHSVHSPPRLSCQVVFTQGERERRVESDAPSSLAEHRCDISF